MDSFEDQLQFEAASLLIQVQDIKGVTQEVVNTLMSQVNRVFESFLGLLLVSAHYFVNTICPDFLMT